MTTFLLNHEIDKGAIIAQRREPIRPEDNVGTLYDRLMNIGTELVLETVERIAAGDYTPVIQENIDESTLRPAPKIFKEDCLIDWSADGRSIVNLVRGLSPYPAAWTRMYRDGAECGTAKIFEARFEPAGGTAEGANAKCGTVVSDGRTYLKVRCGDGWVSIESVQIAGKKRLGVRELLAGLRDPESCAFA